MKLQLEYQQTAKRRHSSLTAATPTPQNKIVNKVTLTDPFEHWMGIKKNMGGHLEETALPFKVCSVLMRKCGVIAAQDESKFCASYFSLRSCSSWNLADWFNLEKKKKMWRFHELKWTDQPHYRQSAPLPYLFSDLLHDTLHEGHNSLCEVSLPEQLHAYFIVHLLSGFISALHSSKRGGTTYYTLYTSSAISDYRHDYILLLFIIMSIYVAK